MIMGQSLTPLNRMSNKDLCTKLIRAILQCFASLPFDQGSTLTSQDYSSSSVVYVQEPTRAMYLASIETQSVVMTSSQ